MQTESFWNEALTHAGQRGGRVLRLWRGRRYDCVLLDVEGRRWFGRTPIAETTQSAGEAPAPLAMSNEAAILGRLPPGVAGLGVLAPALLAHGSVDGRPYLIRQWIDAAETGCTEDELAEVCERLRHYDTQPLPRDFADQWHAGRRPGLNRRIETVKQWVAAIEEDTPAASLFAVVAAPPDSIQQAFSHGAVSPGSLLRNDAGLWLVNFGEAAAKRAEFYDVAHCYFTLRVVPRVMPPGAFAARYHRRLARAERGRCRDAFRWHLASLVIAGYRDHFSGAVRIPRMNLDLLADDVLRGRLPI